MVDHYGGQFSVHASQWSPLGSVTATERQHSDSYCISLPILYSLSVDYDTLYYCLIFKLFGLLARNMTINALTVLL